MSQLQMLINGEMVASSSSATYDVINPSTEEVISTAPRATKEDVRSGIDAASAAFETWRDSDPWFRAKVLRRVADLIEERAEEIATLVTQEIGKPISEARAEVKATYEVFDWFADEARRIYGQIIPSRTNGQNHHVTFEPVGVVAAFSAWNFPILLMSRKIAPAIAAGCTIICRPSDEAPGATLAVAKCCLDAGVPAGVINVVVGSAREVTECVMSDPRIRKISFTGSIPVGQELVKQSADTLKRVTVELGGHAPVIIHPDIDVEKVAKACVQAKFRNAGQVCASPTRFFVHDSIRDSFLEAFRANVALIKVGDGMDPEVDMGPLVNRKRLLAIESLVESSIMEGAELICGGRRLGTKKRGYFYEPTVIAYPNDNSKLMTEEPFGPIAAVTTFTNFEEVINRANALEFGLCAYAFTQSLELAHKTAKALAAGVVGINTFAASSAETPFGGIKQSGTGREGSYLGIRDYLEAKYIHIVVD